MTKRREVVPTRYLVEWHPTDVIEAECTKLGMRPDDRTSFWDWVEIPDFAEQREFRLFADAVAFARSVHKADCFGGARIYRQVQNVVRVGQRHVIRWDSECFWDGITGDDEPHETAPDEWMEVA